MSLTGSAIALIPDMPESVMLPEKNYTSTSDAVLSRRHIELAPINDGLTFSTKSNNELIFQIASTNAFLDIENFYITGEMYIDGTVTAENAKKYFKMVKTGISSFIESVEVRSASTMTTFDKLEGYSVFCSSEDDLFMTKDALRTNFVGEFKSDTDADYGSEYTVVPVPLPVNVTVPNTFDSVTLTAGYPSAQDTFQAGSLSFMNSAELGMEVIYGQKPWIAAGRTTAALVTRSVPDPYVPAGVYGNGFQVVRPDYCQNPGRSVMDANQLVSKVPFALRLRNGFFRQKNLFPLMLLPRGIQIVIKFDAMAGVRGFMAMSPQALAKVDGQSAIADLPVFEPKFLNLRAQCILNVMHSSINNQYLDLFTSGKGLLIPFTSYKFYQKVLSSTSTGTETIDINVGVRSARSIIARLTTSALWNGTDVRGYLTDTLHSAMRLGLASYQFKSGSLDWPIRQVEVNKYYTANVAQHQNITGKLFREQNNTSYRYEETPYLASNATNMCGPNASAFGANWRIGADSVTPSCAPYSGKGYYMVENIGRDDGYFSGTDISMQPLRIQLTFGEAITSEYTTEPTMGAGWLDSRLLQCFIAHDAYIHMSEAGGIVRLT